MTASPSLEPRPPAVVVVRHAPLASEYERSYRRVEVSLYARREGYALVELFELPGVPEADRGVWARACELVVREEVRTVLVSGDVGSLPECLSGLVVVGVPVPGAGREEGSRRPVLFPSTDRPTGRSCGGGS